MSREAKNWFEAQLEGFCVDGTEFCEWYEYVIQVDLVYCAKRKDPCLDG
jgi:hypothetical protein